MRFLLALILMPALLIGCSSDEDGRSEDGEVTLILNWDAEPQFGGFYEAVRSGAFTERGLTAELQTLKTSVPQALDAGRVDYAIVSGDQLIQARARGADLVALFAVYQTTPRALMTREDHPAQSIEDVLASDRIAIENGLPWVRVLRSKYGDRFSADTVAYAPGLSIYDDTSLDAQQCFYTSEPIALRKRGHSPKVFLMRDAGYDPYTTVLATNRKYLEQNRDEVQRVVSAVRAGWIAYLNDPSAANKVMADESRTLEQSDMDAMAQAQRTLILPDGMAVESVGEMTGTRWQTLIDQLHDAGVIATKPAAADCFATFDK